MTIIMVLLIVALGAFTRTVFGFGEALVTMPLLALIAIDLKAATALIGALGLIVAIPAVIRHRQQIDIAVVRRLVIGSLLGVPVGIALMTYVPTTIVLRTLAGFLILYGSYNRYQLHRHHVQQQHLQSHHWDYLAGIISGVMGSAYNSHGVPVVIYGTLKKWPVASLRGILQAHFICVGTIVVISHILAGFWTIQVLQLLGLSLPLLLVVIPLGNWVSTRIDSRTMVRYIYDLLIVFGCLLLYKTL